MSAMFVPMSVYMSDYALIHTTDDDEGKFLRCDQVGPPTIAEFMFWRTHVAMAPKLRI